MAVFYLVVAAVVLTISIIGALYLPVAISLMTNRSPCVLLSVTGLTLRGPRGVRERKV
jgi:hypothetical protein